MRLDEYSWERMGELVTGLGRLGGSCDGDCERVHREPGVVGDSKTTGRFVVVGVEAIINCTLCAKDMGDRGSVVFGVESKAPSGGVIRFLGIGESAATLSAVEAMDLGEVENEPAHPRNRDKGTGDAMFSVPS